MGRGPLITTATATFSLSLHTAPNSRRPLALISSASTPPPCATKRLQCSFRCLRRHCGAGATRYYPRCRRTGWRRWRRACDPSLCTAVAAGSLRLFSKGAVVAVAAPPRPLVSRRAQCVAVVPFHLPAAEGEGARRDTLRTRRRCSVAIPFLV